MRLVFTVLCALIFSGPVHAVLPDEILQDPVLEARARTLSEGFRCLVCQNQNIDESEAPLARDLRILIREQLAQKKSDAEITDFVVARYGDYVLLKPPFNRGTILLWLAPFALLLAGGLFLLRRKPENPTPDDKLSKPEEIRLKQILSGVDNNKKP
jgi:cytochrome c-type biogenesis protein CcmH